MVSASTDNTVAVWDVLTGETTQRFRFPSPVLKVQFHPRKEAEILVCPIKHPPVIVNLEDGSHRILPVGNGNGEHDEGDSSQVRKPSCDRFPGFGSLKIIWNLHSNFK